MAGPEHDAGTAADAQARTPISQSVMWWLRRRLRGSRVLRRVVVARRHRGLGPGDFYVASYPRSGNTWVRFVLGDLVAGRPVDFIEVERLIPSVGVDPSQAPAVSDGGRLVKTHEAHRASYKRGVYLIRDARDVLVSWYRVTREDPDDLRDIDSFVADFATHRASPYGAWHTHVRSWLAAAEREEEIRVLRFEDLRRDPVGTFAEIASAAGIEASRERIALAIERNDPASMREREKENIEFLRRSFGYMSRGTRTGAGGEWSGMLSERHLELLRPALELNAELGYEAEREAAAAGSGS